MAVVFAPSAPYRFPALADASETWWPLPSHLAPGRSWHARQHRMPQVREDWSYVVGVVKSVDFLAAFVLCRAERGDLTSSHASDREDRAHRARRTDRRG